MTNILSCSTSLEELIFSSKNKEYGAYFLRKKYKLHLTFAMFIVITAAITGTAIYRTSNNSDVDLSKKEKDPIVFDTFNIPTIEKNKSIPELNVQPKTSTIKFTPPIVRNDVEVQNEYMPTVEELKDVNPGLKTIKGVEDGVDYISDEEVLIEEELETPKEFYNWAEEMPVPIGGTESIMKKIIYPEIAKRAGVEGKVIVLAYVDVNGTVTKSEIIKSIGAGCDEEALNAVMNTKFKPGKQNGNPVSVKVTIPVLFKLR